MLLIDRKQKRFKPIPSSNLSAMEVLERSDLQKMILTSGDSFFVEMGEPLKLIGEEVRPSDFVSNRIDLLGIDPEGSIVVIELKRDKDKLQLLQALSYAGMIAKWQTEDIIEQFSFYSKKSPPDAKSEIEEFLDAEDVEVINQSQRIILVAEDYDYEVLITAEWLRNRYKIDIRCYRLSLAVHGDDAFLACIRIFPPTELTEQSISPAVRNAGKRLHFADLDALVAWVENPALADFVRQQLASKKWDERIARGRIRLRVENKRRFILYVKKTFAYVLQVGRFLDDEKFWSERLSSQVGLRVITHGRRLRFRLRTSEDFAAFQKAWETHVSKVTFVDTPGETDSEDDEDGEPNE